MESQKEFTCICGKVFTNGQQFNGHKSHCREHQLHKHGSLDAYYARQTHSRMIMTNNLIAKRKEQRVQRNLDKQAVLNIWLSEGHRCKVCGTVMKEYYGSGVYCSEYCAHSRVISEETKKKISESLSKNSVAREKRYCLLCNKSITYDNKTGYCRNCLWYAPELQEYRRKSAEYRSSFIKNRKYWMPRNQTSYAEQFWMKVLNNNDISFEHDKVVIINSKHHYFLDFYIEKGDKLIDLEIDGKQHNYEDRKVSDIERDKYLKSRGYLVYRISWNEINSEQGKLLMKSKIDEFLDYYKSL